MARIKQFSDDLGISYKKAKNLIMAGRKNNDRGKSALDKYLEEMQKSQKKADRLAAEDANMVLKRKNGGGASSGRDYTPAGGTEIIKEKKKKVPSPIEMPDEIRRKRAKKRAKDNPRSMAKDTVVVERAAGGLERRGDDQPVIKAKDGKYNSHGSSCGCAMCGGETVRGMGKAYQGNPRAAKIR